MELLIVFTSEEKGVEQILEILAENEIERGVVIDSQGMWKILRENLDTEKIFGIFADRRPFNKTIMAIVEKENVQEIIESINKFWNHSKDKERKKNRVMFSLPLNNLVIGIR